MDTSRPFWDNIEATFTKDGKKVIIQTLGDTYLVTFGSNGKLQSKKLSHLQGHIFQVFPRGDQEMFLCDIDAAKSKIKLEGLNMKEKTDF